MPHCSAAVQFRSVRSYLKDMNSKMPDIRVNENKANVSETYRKEKLGVFLKSSLESSSIKAKSTVEPNCSSVLPNIMKTDKVVQSKLAIQEESRGGFDQQLTKDYFDKRSKEKFNINSSIEDVVFEEQITDINYEANSSTNLQKYTRFQPVLKPSKLEESLRKSLQIDADQPSRYEKGITKSTNHMILEMNEFYIDMAEQLRYLKGNLQLPSRYINEDELSEMSDWTYVTDDPKLLPIMEEIGRNESKMAESMTILKEARQALQKEICFMNNSVCDNRESQDYLHVTCFEPPEIEVLTSFQENEIETNKKQEEIRKTEKVIRNEKDFVEKNKKLAKEYSMSRYCLTDEEKIKLKSLLVDIDDASKNQKDVIKGDMSVVNVDCKKVHFENSCTHEDCGKIESCSNGFKLEDEEEKLLSDLDSKLEIVHETVLEDLNKHDEGIDLKVAERRGKYWKFQLMQKRLKTIDTSLAVLQKAKDKECEEMKEIEINDDGNGRNNNEQIYIESIQECGLKMEEIEKEIELERNESVCDEESGTDNTET